MLEYTQVVYYRQTAVYWFRVGQYPAGIPSLILTTHAKLKADSLNSVWIRGTERAVERVVWVWDSDLGEPVLRGQRGVVFDAYADVEEQDRETVEALGDRGRAVVVLHAPPMRAWWES